MRSGIYLYGILTVLAILDIGGCRRAGTWLAKDDMPVHADVMVLLMGDLSDRVLQVADLYDKGIADKLIIVKESMGAYGALEARGADIISSTQQAHDAAVILGIPADSITILSGDARSTLDEALAVRDYLAADMGTDTLLLVSSAHHMRRASIIFRTVLRYPDKKVHIFCSPSAYTSFNGKYWWKDKEDIQDVVSELVKLVAFQTIERWAI
jgi:uncharacterized SAM-binding protein YcdF (DUF218 family)